MDDMYFTGGRRASAIVIDSIVVSLISATICALTELGTSMSITLLVLMYLVFALYATLMHHFFGRTVGKFLYKLQVLDSSSRSKPSFAKSCLRDLIASISYVTVLWFPWGSIATNGESVQNAELVSNIASSMKYWLIAELLFVIFNKEGKAIHDLIAKTIVVHYPHPLRRRDQPDTDVAKPVTNYIGKSHG
jgi:uncharacterized RDD family membrane protein YckC